MVMGGSTNFVISTYKKELTNKYNKTRLIFPITIKVFLNYKSFERKLLLFEKAHFLFIILCAGMYIGSTRK
jgi:hypothetical protein